MNQKCYLCGINKAQIIERPMGYDGNHIICPYCSEYRISRNAMHRITHGHKVPDSLISKVRSHFEKTGKPYEISTMDL